MPVPGLNEPFPSRDAIVKPDGKAADVFVRWNEQSLIRRLQSTPVLPDPVEVIDSRTTALAGTIGGVQSGGLYTVSAYAQILTPAAIANSLQLTIGWTFNGVAHTEVFTALTGLIVGASNTRQGVAYPIWIDPQTTVSYSFAYVSNPAAAMVWSAAVALTMLQSIGE